MHIMAFEKSEQERWEHTRVIAFNVARFGNSDPKKFPSSVKRFLPFPWDEGDEEIDLIAAARARRQNKKNG